MILYRCTPGDTRARIVTFAEASADVRANGEAWLSTHSSGVWPWTWIGLLYAGQIVKTATATYALNPVTLQYDEAR